MSTTNKSTPSRMSLQTTVEAPPKEVKKKVVSVLEELERGNVINKERICKKNVTTKYEIKPLYMRPVPGQPKKPKKHSKSSKFHYFKIVYPKTGGSSAAKVCRHYDNTIIDRQIIDRAKHISLLATPKAKPPLVYPRYVKVEVPPCSNRINEIAQPKKSRLVLTWQEHASHISPEMIENFNKMLDQYAFTSTDETMKYIKQQRQDEKFRRNYEKRRIRQIKRMAQKRKIRDTKEIIEHLFNNVKPFLLQDQTFELIDDLAARSECITKLLCEFTGIPHPCKHSKDIFDRFILNLSDKYAIWLSHLLNAANYNTQGEMAMAAPVTPAVNEQEKETVMYPIDDYIEWIPDDEDHTTRSKI